MDDIHNADLFDDRELTRLGVNAIVGMLTNEELRRKLIDALLIIQYVNGIRADLVANAMKYYHIGNT